MRKMSAQAAALWVLREKALKGDQKALDRIVELARQHNSDPADHNKQPLPAEDEAILAHFEAQVIAARVSEGRQSMPRVRLTPRHSNPRVNFRDAQKESRQ